MKLLLLDVLVSREVTVPLREVTFMISRVFSTRSTLIDLAVLVCVYLFVKYHEVQNCPRHSQKQVRPLSLKSKI